MSSRGYPIVVLALLSFSQAVVLETAKRAGPQSGTVDAGVPTYQKRYPNLYFSAADLPRLRYQAQTSHARLYKTLGQTVSSIHNRGPPPELWQEFSAKWNEIHGNRLALLAMYCVLTPHDRQAFALVKTFMERLTRYPNWLVRGKELDDVPVAHSLLGFVTALDFLHDSFTSDERQRYVAKVQQVGAELYKRAGTLWWGRSFIQNHVATNYMALLSAAIVIRPYYPEEVVLWEKRSILALNLTMEFLKLVVDGSFQEGVSYGSYTMRSLTQFMFLSQRHFQYSYKDNYWVKEHFNFLLYTILPGYKRTIGIADSTMDWAYGPESQLTFLENFVYRDGKAIWLANRIKQWRPAAKQASGLSHIFSTLYTEFLFYYGSEKKTPATHSKLHVFSDWGVITYGGGTPAGQTFLSFKCSRLHGRAINALGRKLGQKFREGFHPGHEQPDQGSFVFITKDQAVVTESFYAPKLTFLENTLMFRSPTGSNSSCSAPYQGQLGECSMWLDFGDSRTWQADSDVVGYSRHGDVVFMSGDMTAWYDRSLGLESVHRTLVMLSPTVLVVTDTIRRRLSNPTTHGSAFFHNVDLPFTIKTVLPGRQPVVRIGNYSITWAHHNGETVNVSTHNHFKIKRLRKATNFVNITTRFLDALSSNTFVFHGPNDELHRMKVSETAKHGIKVSLKLNSSEYSIVLSTRHDNPRFRHALLGSTAYATLRINQSKVLHLGLKRIPDGHFKEPAEPASFVDQIEENDRHVKIYPDFLFFTGFFLAITFLCVSLKSMKWLGRLYFRNRYFRCTTFGFAILCLTTQLTFLSKSQKLFAPTWSQCSLQQYAGPLRSRDAVLVMGLPSSGAEIARELFTTNTDFVTINVPSRNVKLPPDVQELRQNLDLCEWKNNSIRSCTDLKTKITNGSFVKWWHKVTKTPQRMRKNGTKDHITLSNPLDSASMHWTLVKKSDGALAAVYFENPGWLFRIPWLNSKIFGNTLTPVLYVVRDPRSWVEHALASYPQNGRRFLEEFASIVHKAELRKDECVLPEEFREFMELSKASLKAHVMLAHIWKAFASYASRLMDGLPQGRFKVVRFESLLLSPRQTSDDIYSFLQMPFTPAVEHRILQITKSGIFRLRMYGVIDHKLTTWGKLLEKEQVLEIEQTCREAMRKLGYS